MRSILGSVSGLTRTKLTRTKTKRKAKIFQRSLL